jgi:DNA-binding NarL/FixJ family response regulator
VTANPGSSLRHLEEIVSSDPGARVIALVDRNDLELVLKAIQGGARAVLVRDAPATALLDAAHDVVDGGAALDMRLASVLFDYLARSMPAALESGPVFDPSTLTGLSPREREVLRALAQGYRNKEIAAALGVSVGTVKTHLRHIFRKLKVADRTSAVLLALHVRPADAA